MAALALLVACSPGPDAEDFEPSGAVRALAAGGGESYATYSHVCAAVTDSVQCWGSNGHGQLGIGRLGGRRIAPSRVIGLDLPARRLAAGPDHTCALLDDGAIACWGRNSHGQSGASGVNRVARPQLVEGLPAEATALAAGSEHSCAVAEGRVYCWGYANHGALGAPASGPCGRRGREKGCTSRPVLARGLPTPVEGLGLGGGFACARSAGAVTCWGRNDRGQLGRGAPSAPSNAAAVPDLTGVSEIAAGLRHACAVSEGRVHCWGANLRGQVDGTPGADRPRPLPVPGLPEGVVELSLGNSQSCARTAAEWFCWGGDAAVRRLPLPESAVAIAAGDDVACAALRSGRVVCRGENDFGQLGDGSAPRARDVPARAAAWDHGFVRDRNLDGRVSVVCVGDSNTRRSQSSPRSWCEKLDGLLPDGWRTINRGLGGATARAQTGRPHAGAQVDYALANDAPDVAILALGTNDVFSGAPPEDIVAGYTALADRLRDSSVEVFVAFTPPLAPGRVDRSAAVAALNEALRKGFPSDRLVDFFAGMTDGDFMDGVHVNPSGQTKRAQAAWKSLRAARGPDGP